METPGGKSSVDVTCFCPATARAVSKLGHFAHVIAPDQSGVSFWYPGQVQHVVYWMVTQRCVKLSLQGRQLITWSIITTLHFDSLKWISEPVDK